MKLKLRFLPQETPHSLSLVIKCDEVVLYEKEWPELALENPKKSAWLEGDVSKTSVRITSKGFVENIDETFEPTTCDGKLTFGVESTAPRILFYAVADIGVVIIVFVFLALFILAIVIGAYQHRNRRWR